MGYLKEDFYDFGADCLSEFGIDVFERKMSFEKISALYCNLMNSTKNTITKQKKVARHVSAGISKENGVQEMFGHTYENPLRVRPHDSVVYKKGRKNERG